MNTSETVQAAPRPYPTRKERPFPKRRRGKKGGKLFFPILIFLSGLVVLFLSICAVYQREVSIFLVEQRVIERGFAPLLSKTHTAAEREVIRQELRDFYVLAKDGAVPDQDLNRVNAQLQKIMDDERIEKEEIRSLLTLIENNGEHL